LLSGVASQTINSIFSSTYANYRILFAITNTTAVDLRFRFTIGGTNTTTNYARTGIGSTTGGAAFYWYTNTSTDAWIIGDTTGTNGSHFTSLDIHNPNVAANTGGNGNYIRSDGQTANFGGFQTSSNQFDGFNLQPGSGTMTGTIRVYGYNN
jgi:hypothetical protein